MHTRNGHDIIKPRCPECGHQLKGDKERMCRQCMNDLRDILRMLLGGGGGLGYFITPRV